MKDNFTSKTICNWCGQITEIVWVHGHGQCRICGTNIEECCKGEVCIQENSQIHSKNLSQKSLNNNNETQSN